jgi:hypothetical protein
MRFRPDRYSHLHLTDVIAGMAECWAVYDAIAVALCAMEDEVAAGGFRALTDDLWVSDTLDFIEFAGELLVIFKPAAYLPLLIQIIRKDLSGALTHIESISEFHGESPEQTAKETGGLAGLLDSALAPWKRVPGRCLHADVCRMLADL